MRIWGITQDRTPGSGFVGVGQKVWVLGIGVALFAALDKFFFSSPTSFGDVFFKLLDVVFIGCRDEAATMYNHSCCDVCPFCQSTIPKGIRNYQIWPIR